MTAKRFTFTDGEGEQLTTYLNRYKDIINGQRKTAVVVRQADGELITDAAGARQLASALIALADAADAPTRERRT